MKKQSARAKRTKSITNQAVDAVEGLNLDYAKIAKSALKVAIPLIAAKMVHGHLRKTNSKAHKWETFIAPIAKEIQAKLKKMK